MQAQRTELVPKLNESGQSINILVKNAAFVGTSGLPGWGVLFQEQSIDMCRRALEVNLAAVFGSCQGLSTLIKEAKGASIINVASIHGMHAPDWSFYEGTNLGNPAAYGASKGGLIQLTRWLATTIAPEVRVNAISAGRLFRNQPEEFAKWYEAHTPSRRMTSEEDFRGAITYLSSDLSKYVTGQVLSVNGGWGV